MVVEMAELAVGVDIPIELGVYGVYLSAFAVLRSSAVMQGAGQAPIPRLTSGHAGRAPLQPSVTKRSYKAADSLRSCLVASWSLV